MFHSTTFTQILKLLDRGLMKKISHKYSSEKWVKNFGFWEHLVSMVGAQLSGARSLRDVEILFSSHKTCLYHLGIQRVKRSTLSDANNRRSFEVFRDLAQALLPHLKPKDKQELTDLVTILDSTLIPLKGRGHAWAETTRTRASNQGLKVHIQYAADSIESVEATGANVNDITVAQQLPLKAGRVYVMDRGYLDFNWWKNIGDAGSLFVTRLKKNTAYRVLHENSVSGSILKDQHILLSHAAPRGGKKNTLAQTPLRCVHIPHPSREDVRLILVSNALDVPADQIADWYKERWAIELFFKWLKQNLKIKKFLGESRNAVLIQIFCALISYILLKLYQRLSKAQGRLKDCLVIVMYTLFHRPQTPQKQTDRVPKNPLLPQQLAWDF